MPRNGFFGVKNAHFAILKDEDALTYDAPVHVPGTVSISMEPTIGESTSYADNETWLQEQQDNGGSGVMSFYDTESDEKVRKLIAELAGFGIAADGRIILSANKKSEAFRVHGRAAWSRARPSPLPVLLPDEKAQERVEDQRGHASDHAARLRFHLEADHATREQYSHERLRQFQRYRRIRRFLQEGRYRDHRSSCE